VDRQIKKIMKTPTPTTAEPPPFTLGEPPAPPAEIKPLDAPTSQNIGQRRKSSVADILAQIDRVLQNFQLQEDVESSAPVTVAFNRELDGPATGPVGNYGERVKKFPSQIFSRFDPEQTIYGNVHRHDFGTLIPFRPETLAALIASAAGHMESTEILTAEEIATLRDLQKKFSAISPQFAKWSNLAAADEFHNQSRRREAETLIAGALPSACIRTHESIITEFSANRKALLELQLEFSHQAYPLVLKAYGKTFEIVRRMMAYFESSERETAKTFHIPWTPSYLWKACAGIQIRLHPSRLADNVPDQISPRSLLVGIIEL
jgi:hypothetical protein